MSTLIWFCILCSSHSQMIYITLLQILISWHVHCLDSVMEICTVKLACSVIPLDLNIILKSGSFLVAQVLTSRYKILHSAYSHVFMDKITSTRLILNYAIHTCLNDMCHIVVHVKYFLCLSDCSINLKLDIILITLTAYIYCTFFFLYVKLVLSK
jgi:hypothetical protein